MSVPKFLTRSFLFYPVLFLFSILTAGAEENAPTPTPEFIRGGKVISIDAAESFFKSKEAEFFDVRSRDDFSKAHIQGARTLPYQENSESSPDFNASLDRFELAQLPPNKGQTVIFYCNGPTCWYSYKAAVLAIEEGYRDVLWFRDGLTSWQAAGLPVKN